MKKLLSALLALCLLLSCLPALAAGTPMVFEELGLNLDFEDVIDSTPYYTKTVDLGICSRSPLIACMELNFTAIYKELLQEITDNYDSFDPEMQQNIRELTSGTNTTLATVVVTDVPEEETDRLLQQLIPDYDRMVEVIEFGRADACRYYVVTMPGFTEPEDYEEFRQYDMDPEEVRTAFQDLQAEAIRVRDVFVERLKTAELYPLVDPMATLIGQTLSFETTDLDGNPVSSADLFRENKVTMINIWGSWCPNCVSELDELAEIHERLLEKGCGIIGLDTENDPIETVKDEVRAILEKNGVTYPNVIQPKGNPILDNVRGYPTTFFADSEGKILTTPILGVRVDKYESTVDQLLSGVPVDTGDQAGAAKNDIGAYRVFVYDMDGHPVEGAIIQLCDETTCAFQPTNADGIATFSTEEQKVYDMHVLKVPEGYAPDQGEYKTMETYSDVSVFLKKTE